jgi:hypothetical protein
MEVVQGYAVSDPKETSINCRVARDEITTLCRYALLNHLIGDGEQFWGNVELSVLAVARLNTNSYASAVGLMTTGCLRCPPAVSTA